MPRYRGTREGTASLVGRLLLLIAAGQETSTSLSKQLGVSSRTVCRYVRQLVEAGWQIERVGTPTHANYYFKLKQPKIALTRKRAAGKSGTKTRK